MILPHFSHKTDFGRFQHAIARKFLSEVFYSYKRLCDLLDIDPILAKVRRCGTGYVLSRRTHVLLTRRDAWVVCS